MKSMYKTEVVDELKNRIDALTNETQPEWGKMNVAEMIAHVNVAYELDFEDIHPRPSAFVRFMLKTFVKKSVVNETPYKKNGRTAPQFLVTDERDFAVEKKRLFDYMDSVLRLGESHYDMRESHSFGKLTSSEWSNSFYKHLDHHLMQFGV